MKKSIYSIAILMIITMAISCKKDKAVSITGFWTGTGMDDGSSTSNVISVLYKSDNKVRVYILSADTTVALKGDGTYSIDVDSVRAITSFGTTTVTFNGKLNSSNNQMSGRVANITNPINGSYTLTKN